jgi:hypothetical protein
MTRYSFKTEPIYSIDIFLWCCGPTRARASSFLRFLDHIQRRTTVCRTSLDERSARRRDLYPTTHNNHNSQTSVPPWGIQTQNLSKRAAADPRPKPHSHWDLHWLFNMYYLYHSLILYLKIWQTVSQHTLRQPEGSILYFSKHALLTWRNYRQWISNYQFRYCFSCTNFWTAKR